MNKGVLSELAVKGRVVGKRSSSSVEGSPGVASGTTNSPASVSSFEVLAVGERAKLRKRASQLKKKKKAFKGRVVGKSSSSSVEGSPRVARH